MKNRPSDVLLRALKEDEKESITAQFAHSELFRKRAIQILMDRYVATMKKQKQPDYSQPAWSEFQADCNARMRTLEEVMKDVFNHEVFSTGEIE